MLCKKKISHVFDLATRYLTLIFFQNDMVFRRWSIQVSEIVYDVLINGELID
jgi:hypothetical protein